MCYLIFWFVNPSYYSFYAPALAEWASSFTLVHLYVTYVCVYIPEWFPFSTLNLPTKCYEIDAQCKLPQNINQDQILVASLLPF